jgi:hypothetical protein
LEERLSPGVDGIFLLDVFFLLDELGIWTSSISLSETSSSSSSASSSESSSISEYGSLLLSEISSRLTPSSAAFALADHGRIESEWMWDSFQETIEHASDVHQEYAKRWRHKLYLDKVEQSLRICQNGLPNLNAKSIWQTI